jgi:hypothetical protein
MSVAGQTRKLALATAMSAFPPMATKLRTSREVGFVISVTPWATTVRAAPVRRRRGAAIPLLANGKRLILLTAAHEDVPKSSVNCIRTAIMPSAGKQSWNSHSDFHLKWLSVPRMSIRYLQRRKP